MNGIALHKERALAFLTALDTNDLASLPNLLADGFVYELIGRIPGGPMIVGKEEFVTAVAPQVRQWFPRGLNFKIVTCIGEGPHVAVQAESHTTLADGRPYANRYHFHFSFAGGKIARVREYLDVVTALDVFNG
jgi:ketosteroid isomerase-like protein